ncbi:MAG: UDP-N-acetylmuramoyl-L-alanyl-D-glutamate--2,6-diaminopimelate ligase [Firmicutes bacterium]|nr:UDP-N-acetylmuramoyl-L-alanyl-D-glutamate--2,6-diaminopimelate ligase [Bacillota bacterium]
MKHYLNEYLEALKALKLVDETNVDPKVGRRMVENVTYDSRRATADTLFICKGARFKEEFLVSSIAAGAFCYVSDKRYKEAEAVHSEVCYIIVKDIRRAIAVLANIYYNKVWENLKTVGITGTKGKSTTAYFVKNILDKYAEAMGEPPCGVLSSIQNYDGIIDEESHLTTPETLELHEHFEHMVETGIKNAVMEVSSQALKYDRTYGIIYDVGAFLNIGEDHISSIEHKDFEDYFTSKLRLFNQCRTLVVNRFSDEWNRIIAAAAASGAYTVVFGRDESCDVYGYDVKHGADGITFKCRTDRFDEEYSIALPGDFNVDNALAAIAICEALDVPLPYIKAGLADAKVSGRMELFRSKDGKVTVVVDYAHNKLSFETLFKAMKEEYPSHSISIVFGCPGGKALGRRRELGEVAGTYSDMIYLTEEDAAMESVAAICEEIAGHLRPMGAKFEIIEDRRQAVLRAIRDAAEEEGNALILVTGKGRETRMKRGTEYIDTPSDVDYVLEGLGNI